MATRQQAYAFAWLGFTVAVLCIGAQGTAAQLTTCVNTETKRTRQTNQSECAMGEEMVLPDFSAAKNAAPAKPDAAKLAATPAKPEPAKAGPAKKAAASALAKTPQKTIEPPAPPPPPPPPPEVTRPIAIFAGYEKVNIDIIFSDRFRTSDYWSIQIDPVTRAVSVEVGEWSNTDKKGSNIFEANLDDIGVSLTQPITADTNQVQTGKYYGAAYVNLVCRRLAPCVREKYTLGGRLTDGGVVRDGIRIAFKTDGEARQFIQSYFPTP